jgi:ribosomal-protein-alanine N-acetyltransferase
MTRIRIDALTQADEQAFLAAVGRSQSLHADWVKPPATVDAFAGYLERASRSDFATFLVRRADDRALAGVINISHIIGEPLSSAFVGFYALEPFSRQGHMRAGLQLALAHVFDVLSLHRIEANIQPANIASIAFVQSLGFRREGFSPKYLRVAGEWRDHERWALLAEEFSSAAATKAP